MEQFDRAVSEFEAHCSTISTTYRKVSLCLEPDDTTRDVIKNANSKMAEVKTHVLRAAKILFANPTDDGARKYFDSVKQQWVAEAQTLNNTLFQYIDGIAFLRAVGQSDTAPT